MSLESASRDPVMGNIDQDRTRDRDRHTSPAATFDSRKGGRLGKSTRPDGSHVSTADQHRTYSRSRSDAGNSGPGRDKERHRDTERGSSKQRNYHKRSSSIHDAPPAASALSRTSRTANDSLTAQPASSALADNMRHKRKSRSPSRHRSRDRRDYPRGRTMDAHENSTPRRKSRSESHYGDGDRHHQYDENDSALNSRENRSPGGKRRRSRSASSDGHRKRSRRERHKKDGRDRSKSRERRRDRDRDKDRDRDRGRDKDRDRDRGDREHARDRVHDRHRDKDRDRDRDKDREKDRDRCRDKDRDRDRDRAKDADKDSRPSRRHRRDSSASRRRSRSLSSGSLRSRSTAVVRGSSPLGKASRSHENKTSDSNRKARSRTRSPHNGKSHGRRRSRSGSKDDRPRDSNRESTRDRYKDRDRDYHRRHDRDKDRIDDSGRDGSGDESDNRRRKSRRDRKRAKTKPLADDYASGANSVEVNMAARLRQANAESEQEQPPTITKQRSPLRGFSSTVKKIGGALNVSKPATSTTTSIPDSSSPPSIKTGGSSFLPASIALQDSPQPSGGRAGIRISLGGAATSKSSDPQNISFTNHSSQSGSQPLPQEDESATHANSQPNSEPDGAQSATAASTGGNKFSFAFKPTKATPATAPKTEIVQKFIAPLTSKTSHPPTGPSRTTDPRDRNAPPQNAPTEPASARAARSSQQPQQPPIPPQTHTIKTTIRKLLPKPKLPEHLATSQSVYYRKPGNESVIGSGTYGKVFKGINVFTQNMVALKKIRMEGERDGFPVTAMREIKLLQYLRHRNVVGLLEVMVEKNECFMVFEYLSHDLTGILNHPTFRLSDAQVKDMSKQMFEGLEYLHSRGVLHRDIKAANILVSKDGVLKLADFGLARFYVKRHHRDYTNRVITIWYRPPELLLGETKYTAAVDVWSAACVMVEIFTQHAIFPGDGTEANQLEKIFSIMGTPTRESWPTVTELPWFQLLRPTHRRMSVFADKYKDKVSAKALELLAAMFEYDPANRPTAAQVLVHEYFTQEEPRPAQCVELSAIDGDWHEFESKAVRREARKARENREYKPHSKTASTALNPDHNALQKTSSTHTPETTTDTAPAAPATTEDESVTMQSDDLDDEADGAAAITRVSDPASSSTGEAMQLDSSDSSTGPSGIISAVSQAGGPSRGGHTSPISNNVAYGLSSRNGNGGTSAHGPGNGHPVTLRQVLATENLLGRNGQKR